MNNTSFTEVELKLALSDAHLDTLLNHPVLATAPNITTLCNTYFDTPNKDLAAARIAVRVRQLGSQVVQTVKTAGQGGGGISSRQEWEWPIETLELDRHGLGKLAPFQGGLSDAIAQLEPVLNTDFRRHSWQMEWLNSRLELSIDKGSIISGSAQLPICELELELKEGKPGALWSLALHLAKCVPLRPSDTSKAVRGNALASQHWPLPDATSPQQWLHRATVALDAYHDNGRQDYLRTTLDALDKVATHPQLSSELSHIARRLLTGLNDQGQPNLAYGQAALTLAQRLADA